VRTDLALEALPLADGAVEEGEVDVVGKIPEFAAGRTQEATLTLAAGKYVLFCNVPGHYVSGMRTSFTVE